MKEFYFYTCEHRCYIVKAENKTEARIYLEACADLSPRDKNVELDEIGDFEIVE